MSGITRRQRPAGALNAAAALPPPSTPCSVNSTQGHLRLLGDIGSVRPWATLGILVQIRGSAFVMAKSISQPSFRVLFLSVVFMNAAIVLMPQVALAAEIPEAFRGTWCATSKDIGGDWGAYSSNGSDCDVVAITIGTADLKSSDQSLSCVIRNAASFDVCPWGMIFKNRKQAQKNRPHQINPWSPGYHMVLECTGSGTRPEAFGVDWVIEKGSIRSGVPLSYRCPWDR